MKKLLSLLCLLMLATVSSWAGGFDSQVKENQKFKNITDWTDIIVNGDMEGESAECFYVSEQGIGGPFVALFTEGIGKDGSRAVNVESYDDAVNDWDSQFFIRLPYQIPAGTPYRVFFDYKADKEVDFDTQAQAEPGDYIYWACIGDGCFTTSWQTYEAEGTITSDMSREDKPMQTIAFQLAKNKERTNFVFDNVRFEIPSDIAAMLTENPATNPKPYNRPVYNSMAIVGELLGLDAESNWNPANGWALTQNADNYAVWTLTKEFEANARTYEYKVTANGRWGDFELPKVGNSSFNFDTPNLGVGEYNLTFTVDTRKHSLDLDVKKLSLTTYTATFITNTGWEEVYAYAWSGEGESAEKFLGDWPGTKLEADASGVYTVTIETTDAPEKIIFNNGNSGEGNQTASFDFVNGSSYLFEVGVDEPVKVAPDGWILATTNGNLAGYDVTNYVMKEYPSTDIVGATIEAGAGTNGSRGIIVRAGDDTDSDAQPWDSSFWIVLPEDLPVGTKIHIEFDYKASQPAKASTLLNGAPGSYRHFAGIGDVNFTTSWQSFSNELELDADAFAYEESQLSIAFNLQEEKSATDYHFDNFGVWYQKLYTVYFINNKNWENVYVWAWNGDVNYTDGIWPGVPAVKTNMQSNGFDVYSWSCNSRTAPAYIVFNNGGNGKKTATMGFVDGKYYDVKGDANGDGEMNVADAVTIANKIIGKKPASFDTDAADVNGDGKVTISDAVGVVDIITDNGGSAPKIEAP